MSQPINDETKTNGEHQLYLVKKRIVKGKNLLGLVVESGSGICQRFNMQQVLAKMLSNFDFIIDVKTGVRPAKLQHFVTNRPDGVSVIFKSVGDRSKFNNLNALPTTTYGTSKKYRVGS